MTDDAYFKLKGTAKILSSTGALETMIKVAKQTAALEVPTLSGLLFEPNALSDLSVKNVRFRNCSFSKTAFQRVTFKQCVFEDCLFIASIFDGVELHDCHFLRCNFFKAKIKEFYGRPEQFRQAIPSAAYANVGVQLYQELRKAYSNSSQREFRSEAEYQFRCWELLRKQEERRESGSGRLSVFASTIFESAYKRFFGFGYRTRNLVLSSLGAIAVAIFINNSLATYYFDTPDNSTVVESIYFTLTTMLTLGSAGYQPNTSIGYIAVTINALIGAVLITALVSALIKKVAR